MEPGSPASNYLRQMAERCRMSSTSSINPYVTWCMFPSMRQNYKFDKHPSRHLVEIDWISYVACWLCSWYVNLITLMQVLFIRNKIFSSCSSVTYSMQNMSVMRIFYSIMIINSYEEIKEPLFPHCKISFTSFSISTYQ